MYTEAGEVDSPGKDMLGTMGLVMAMVLVFRVISFSLILNEDNLEQLCEAVE